MIDATIHSDLLQSYKNVWTPPFSGSVFGWASEFVELTSNYAIPGKFDVSISRYLIEPFNDLLNNNVRQINLVSAIQTFKSGVSEIFTPYIIVNDAGPVLKLHQTDEMAATFTETRLIPLLEKCEPVRQLLSVDRFSAKKRGINLPHMAVKISGPKESVLAGMSIRYLMLDEAWLYPHEVIQKAKGRTSAFSHNCKIIITSQPGIEGDDLSKEFNAGIVFEWSWLCPKCNHYQPWYWNKEKPESTKEKPVYAGIKWDKVLTKDGKGYDYDLTGNTARLVCYHCPHEINDTEVNRRTLNDTGKYLCVKENGNPEIHSYTWNAFANMRINFKSKVIQYLQAKEHQKKTGNSDLLTVFNQQVLGKEKKKYDPITIKKIVSEVYDPAGVWPQEAYRFMTVDYQKRLGERWYVIRAWATNGESRLIKYGHVHTWDEIEKIANDNQVARWNVMVDSGFNSQEVYAESVLRGAEEEINGELIWLGWSCLNGDKQNSYINDGVRQYYKESFVETSLGGNPNYAGKSARLITWSNYSIKTILFHLKEGNGVMWLSPTNDAEYERQLNAEQLETVEDKDGIISQRFVQKHNENHLFDCECEQVLAAYMVGVIGNLAATSPVIQPNQEVPLAA